MHAHFNKIKEKDQDEAVAAATALVYYDDPLHLAIPYMFFLELFRETPNGMIKSILSYTLIVFAYFTFCLGSRQVQAPFYSRLYTFA